MKTKILIVEDEGLIALGLKQHLEKSGYSVPTIADNAADALTSVERHGPALVMMDIRLRGRQDGISTADQIRKRFHIPVIFVTAHADGHTLDRARITEPFGYIVKPFHGVDFRAQIEMALWKHKMEQKLQASEAWLSATLKNVADPLIATDTEGNIAFINKPAADITGWDSEEAKGKPLLDVLQVFDETTDLPVVNPLHYINDNQELSTEPRVLKLRQPGTTSSILIEAEISPNRICGSLLGVIIVFRDASARLEAERENRQKQKLEAVALMANGLGNDLASLHDRIQASLHELLTRSQGDTLRLVEDLCRKSREEQVLVQELLELGRRTAGKPVDLNLNDLLTEMEHQLTRALGVRRVLRLKLQPGIPLISVDPGGLRENLLRLVINSRYGIPDEGEVEVSTYTVVSSDTDREDEVKMVIRDSGKAIRDEARERVFDPYFKSRAGRNPRFALALVHQFAVSSGGRLDVEHVPPAGAAYSLTLPATAKQNCPPTSDSMHLSISA